MAVSAQHAHDIATQVLIAMSERPEDLAQFLESSGLQVGDLRQITERPDIVLFLLDFLVENDDRLIGFAQRLEMRPADIMAARTALAGPGSYGWSTD